jgi:protein-tyrosine phosphatase
MNYMHIPMRDHDPPEQESLAAAVERIETELKSGRVLLVHCQAGRGRTMRAIGAYLIKSKGMGARRVGLPEETEAGSGGA